MRTNRIAFRRAVAASVVLHLVIGIGITAIIWSKPAVPPPQRAVDNGIDVVVRVFDVGTAIPVPAPLAASDPPDPPVEPIHAVDSATSRPPRAVDFPRTLSSEVLAIISRAVATQDAVGFSPTPAIHGAMTPGKTVVYVIDSSGSMGEHGKFAYARAALVSTLRGQPEGVRFQVVIYGSSARSLMPEPVNATLSNVQTVAIALASLEPKGRSNHIDAVGLAARYRPDVILILTDAQGLSAAQFKPVLTAVGASSTLFVTSVTPTSIGKPQELR